MILKKILTTIFISMTSIFSHEVILETKNVNAKLVQIRFSDGTPFSYEKCEIFYLEEKDFKPFQVVFTNSYGEFTFLPKNPGKYKIQCFRADGHGISQEIEIQEIHFLNTQKNQSLDINYYLKYLIGLVGILLLFLFLFKFKNKENAKVSIFLVLFISFSFRLYSHHGIASLGSVGIRGPGAAVETSTQGVLPENQWLYLMKLDSVRFKTYTPERDEEMIENNFYMFGLGYGIQSYLTFYAFLPYNQKTVENQSFNTSGFADLSLYFVLGFKYDEKFYLNPKQESLDELQDYHFSLYLGSSIPTGTPNLKTPDGDIDPGMSLGFGKPAFTLGGTISKFYEQLTWNIEISYLKFQPYKYLNDITTKFGDEIRGNFALIYRFHHNEQTQFRFDGFLELNYLKIFPDKEKGISNKDKLIYLASQNQIPINSDILNENFVFSTIPPWQYEATIEDLIIKSEIPESNLVDILISSSGIPTAPSGGQIYYLTPGFRIYYKNMSFALGVKLPIQHIPNKIDLGTQLAIESIKASEKQTEPDFLSVLWNYKVLEEHLYQGSEGKEKYRLILSLSFLF